MKCVHRLLALLVLAPGSSHGQRPERGRDLGIPFEGTTGPLNAITDVAGVEVGHRTLVAGGGEPVGGKGTPSARAPPGFPPRRDTNNPPFSRGVTPKSESEKSPAKPERTP